jgi:hypothetical protein
MKVKELVGLLSCTEGYELFDKVEEILNNLGISVYDENGKMKDLYALCCDVAEVMNKEK